MDCSAMYRNQLNDQTQKEQSQSIISQHLQKSKQLVLQISKSPKVTSSKIISSIENISEQYSKSMQQQQPHKCLSCEAWEKWALQSQHIILMIEKKLIQKENTLQSKMKLAHNRCQNQSKEQQCFENISTISKQNGQFKQFSSKKDDIVANKLSFTSNRITTKDKQVQTQNQNKYQNIQQHPKFSSQQIEEEHLITFIKPKEIPQNSTSKIQYKSKIQSHQHLPSKSSNLISKHILINGQQQYTSSENKLIQQPSSRKLIHRNKTGRQLHYTQQDQENIKQTNQIIQSQILVKQQINKNIKQQQYLSNYHSMKKGKSQQLKQQYINNNQQKQIISSDYGYDNQSNRSNKQQKQSKLGLIRSNQNSKEVNSQTININSKKTIPYKRNFNQMEIEEGNKQSQHNRKENNKHNTYNYAASYYVEKNKQRKSKLGINTQNSDIYIDTNKKPTYYRQSQIFQENKNQPDLKYRQKHDKQMPYQFIRFQVDKRSKPTQYLSIRDKSQGNQFINSLPFPHFNSYSQYLQKQEKNRENLKQSNKFIKQNKTTRYQSSKQLQHKNLQFNNKLLDLQYRVKQIEKKQQAKISKVIPTTKSNLYFNTHQDANQSQRNSKIGTISQNRIQRIRSQQLLKPYEYEQNQFVKSGKYMHNNILGCQKKDVSTKAKAKYKMNGESFNYKQIVPEDQNKGYKLHGSLQSTIKNNKPYINFNQHHLSLNQNNNQKISTKQTRIQDSKIKEHSQKQLSKHSQGEDITPIVNSKISDNNSLISQNNNKESNNKESKQCQSQLLIQQLKQVKNNIKTQKQIEISKIQENISQQQQQINSQNINQSKIEQNQNSKINQNLQQCQQKKRLSQKQASLQFSKSSQQQLNHINFQKQQQNNISINKKNNIQKQNQQQSNNFQKNNKMKTQIQLQNNNHNDTSKKIINCGSMNKVSKVMPETLIKKLNNCKSQANFKQSNIFNMENFNTDTKTNTDNINCNNATQITRYKSQSNQDNQYNGNKKIRLNIERNQQESNKKRSSFNEFNEMDKNNNGFRLLTQDQEVPWEHTTLKTVKLKDKQLFNGQKNKMHEGNCNENSLQKNTANKQQHSNNQLQQKFIVRELSRDRNPEYSRHPVNKTSNIISQFQQLKFQNQNLKSYNTVLLQNLSRSKLKKY